MKTNDKIQIALNIIAFLVLIISSGGTGSFWGFLTFNIIAAIVLIEIILSKDSTAKWIWITKTVTYTILTIKFSHNMGEIKSMYIAMILVSAGAVVVSRRLIKRRAVALWGQNVAYLIGAYMYVVAVYSNPHAFGIYHMLFWLVNAISYALLIRDIIIEKKAKVNLIIPVYACIVSLLYILLILILQQLKQ